MEKEVENIMAETKGFCYGRRQKNSGTNSQQGRGRSSSPSPIATKQAPRGKRALLCCISYKKKKFELKGTIHDMKNMKELLLHQFHFPPDSILILAGTITNCSFSSRILNEKQVIVIWNEEI